MDEQFLQASIDDIDHQRAIITSHSFNSLAIHLIVLIWFGEVQTCVPFFIYE